MNPKNMGHAVDLQERSYRLLRWLSSAVSEGTIRFEQAHRYSTVPEAAQEWIRRNYLNLPVDARPADQSPEGLEEFANMFGSYLTSSFDLVPEPGVKVAFCECGPDCPYCRWFEAAPHLKTKKLTESDRRRARKLKAEYLASLAKSEGLTLENEMIDELLSDSQVRAHVAMATYGSLLVKRLQGITVGPAALALWREFAWKPEGSPRKDFQLKASSILDSEREVLKKASALTHS